MRMSEMGKDKTPNFRFRRKAGVSGVENLTFLDYYTVKEKVKESQKSKIT